jgi:hypothetical protein
VKHEISRAEPSGLYVPAHGRGELRSPPEELALRSQFVILETGRERYSKYTLFAFTEHGVAMLSSVLN